MKTICALLLGLGLLLSGAPGPLVSAVDAGRAHDGKAWAASTFARMPKSGAAGGRSGGTAGNPAGNPSADKSASAAGNPSGGGSSAPSASAPGNAAHKENALSERLEGMKKMSDDLME